MSCWPRAKPTKHGPSSSGRWPSVRDSVPAHSDLAAVLLWQGDVTGARLHCEAALAIAPKYVPAHLELAKALAAAGQTGQAALHYQQVLQLSPGNLLARRGLAELQSAAR